MKAVKYLSGAAMGLALVLASAQPASAQGIDLSSFNIPTETGRVAVTYEVTVNWEQTATGNIFTTTDVVVLYWDNGEIVDQRGTVEARSHYDQMTDLGYEPTDYWADPIARTSW